MRIVIHPYSFSLPDLFDEDLPVDSRAVDFLNAARASGLKEIFAPLVKKAEGEGEKIPGSLLSQFELDRLEETFSEIAETYFLPKVPRTRASWTLQDEIYRTAKGFAQAEARRTGKDVEELMLGILRHSDTQFLARARFAAHLRAAEESLEDLLR
jgi:hypothetical protein